MRIIMNSRIAMLKKPKVQILLLLGVLATLRILSTDNAAGKIALLATSLSAALFAEWALFGNVKKTALQSAAITGVIIGILIAPGGNLSVAWVAAVLAIASKKWIRFPKTKTHIFNPAAFGIVSSIVLFGNRVNWWGNSMPILILFAGGLILLRLHRLALPFSYFIVRAATAALLGGAALHSALLLPNLCFAFIMLVEPKTSPGKQTEQWIFGGLCGFAATLAYLYIPSFEGDLIALLTLNLFRPLIAFSTRIHQKGTAS
jgi:Na+-translocating ferredoxin:NAD+ oxidoreductase RnfD subunit